MSYEHETYTDNTQDDDCEEEKKELCRELGQKEDEIITLQTAIIGAMAELIESRSVYAGSHIDKIICYESILLKAIAASELPYADEARANLSRVRVLNAQLHDVGKIAISDALLNKPGKLTKEEFQTVKQHAKKGAEIIERIQAMLPNPEFLDSARLSALSHHEKWDGSGYPSGLKEEDIPLEGRVLAIADVYDALTSVRPYKSAYSHDEAYKMILEGSGKHFDPALVEIFQSVASEFEEIVLHGCVLEL
jgi:putative two-component system response regulator